MITAGVYVNVGGLFPFQVGPTKRGDTLGVVRLGGHREADETGWQCAKWEAFEEAKLHVTLVRPPATYWIEVSEESALRAGSWLPDASDEVTPILVSTRKDEYLTPIYLGYSHDVPQPSEEAKGLLLLKPADIARIVRGTLTLRDYLDIGGEAIFREDIPAQLVLEPFPHLRFLTQLIQLHPEIATWTGEAG